MNKEKAIKVFEEIRDIPYRIPLTAIEVDHSCSGKHMLLKKELERLGYTVRHRVCSFRWSSVDLPIEVTRVPHEDASTHSYLEFKKDDIWIPVDATWDQAISSVLSSNSWDGESATPIAVKANVFFSPEESEQIMTQISEKEVESDLEINGQFYAAFNDWLAEVRSH